MNRARFAIAATVMVIGFVVASAPFADAQQAPQLNSVLAGKKLTPPIRGEAQVEFTACAGNSVGCTRREGNTIVTTVPVKNVSSAPIARLRIDVTWYDKAGTVVTGGQGVLSALLQPGEVQTIRIETPYDGRMSTNNFLFAHVNGTIKPKRVAKLDVPRPAAEPAAAKK
jgi:hypothetical protein